jgi:hypothetical protein
MLFDVIDWKDEIRIVRYNHSHIAFAPISVDQEVAGKIYIRTLFLGLKLPLCQNRLRASSRPCLKGSVQYGSSGLESFAGREDKFLVDCVVEGRPVEE